MDNYGLYGPFKNPNDINNLWYQVAEKELEESIEQAKKDYEDPDNSKEDREIYKQDLKSLKKELENLQNFADSYHRCLERFKRDKKILKELEEDWHDYNTSLWEDYLRIQRMTLDSSLTKGEGLREIQNESRAGEIKRQEIERRTKKLLS